MRLRSRQSSKRCALKRTQRNIPSVSAPVPTLTQPTKRPSKYGQTMRRTPPATKPRERRTGCRIESRDGYRQLRRGGFGGGGVATPAAVLGGCFGGPSSPCSGGLARDRTAFTLPCGSPLDQ